MGMELKKKRVSAISLGCDKNRVDLERMLYLLKDYGFAIVNDGEECDVVIINTCAFILPAREEAVKEILMAVEQKRNKKIEKIIVTGCLNEKNLDELKKLLPEVDGFLPIHENAKIVNIIERTYGVKESKTDSLKDRVLTGSGHYAFLKIADGCNNMCSYCTIPRIRGRYKSVPQKELLAEAKKLVSQGVKELIIVAQDSTRYGEDIYKENKLVELVEELSKIKNLVWIRLLYCYPEKVSKKLLDLIENNPKVCKYIDIPLQHIDNTILKDMNRRLPELETRALFSNIKEKYPNVAIRSTFILGFPGETKRQFNKLCNFIKIAKIDYAGFFPYSREEGTRAYFMRKQLFGFTKKQRIKKATLVQKEIMEKNCNEKVGKHVKVLIDYFDQTDGFYVGHTEFLTPEVDPIFKVADNGKVEIGKFYKVEVKSFENLEFKGEII